MTSVQWAMVESDHPVFVISENNSTGMLWPGLSYE